MTIATTANCPACSVRRIMEETKFIHKAQSLIEYGNSHVLHSFKVRLVIDEPVDGDAHTQAQAQAQRGNLI